MATAFAFVLLSLLCGQAVAVKAKVAATAPTPMSKVVELLGILKTQLEADVEADSKLFGEYSSWFGSEIGKLMETIDDTKQTIDALDALLQDEEAKREAHRIDLEKAVADETQAARDLKDQIHIREEEHKAFLKSESELVVAIDQFARSIEVLRKEQPKAEGSLLESGSSGLSTAHASSSKEKLLTVARQLRETMEHSRDFSLTDSQRESLDELFRIAAAHSREGSTAAPQQAGVDDASDATPTFLQVRAKARAKAKAKAQTQAKAQADGKDEADPYGEYEAQTGGLMDTLRVVHERTQEELEKARDDEQEAREVFSELKVQLETFIENKQGAIASLKVHIAEGEQRTGKATSDKQAVEELLKSSTAELAKLDTDHKVKMANFQERFSKREDEELAVKEALQILTSDQARRLIEAQFSAEPVAQSAKVGKSQEQPADQEEEDEDGSEVAPSSFLQIQSASSSQPAPVALSFLATQARAQRHSSQYSLMRAEGSADPFEKVKGLIRGMLHKLSEAQAQETKQAAWCDSEMAKSTKERRSRTADVRKMKDRIEEMEARGAELADEVKATTKTKDDMGEAAEEAVELRMRESEHVSEALVQYREAQNILKRALEVMKKFYENEERNADSAFKASGAGSGVVGLLEVALSDYASLEEEMSLNERVAKKDFDDFMSQHRVSLKVLQKDLEYKQGELVKLEGEKMRASSDLKSYQKELDAVEEYLKQLKATCTIKGDSYDERKDRREKELDALKNALDFLRSDDGV